MRKEDLELYFEKIQFDKERKVGFSVLQSIQEQHSHTFPFENLNPLLEIPVRLDIESLSKKFLHEHRGGYCYEQNLFLKHVLETIGFKVRGLHARVYTEGKINGRTHMILLV